MALKRQSCASLRDGNGGLPLPCRVRSQVLNVIITIGVAALRYVHVTTNGRTIVSWKIVKLSSTRKEHVRPIKTRERSIKIEIYGKRKHKEEQGEGGRERG